MRTETLALNPFSLMMDPQTVLLAMEKSAGLKSLRRRQLHPLDKPVIPYIKGYTPPHLRGIDNDDDAELNSTTND